jgi:hypothetical protein
MRILTPSLVVSGLLCAGAAWAEEPAPAAPAEPVAAAAPAAEPAPAPLAAPAESPLAPAASEADPAPAPPAAPAEAEEFPAAWFRIDSDLGGLQLWAGATHALADGIGLASDIYVLTAGGASVGEFDIGPAITAGPVTLTPMVGISFNWDVRHAGALIPQFYALGGVEPVYFELWTQMFLNSVFNEGADNWLYTRLFVDISIGKYFALGPQIEPTFGLNNGQDAVTSLPVGGNVMLTNYGEGNTLIGFLGYETNEDARDSTGGNALAGRLTFIHNF